MNGATSKTAAAAENVAATRTINNARRSCSKCLSTKCNTCPTNSLIQYARARRDASARMM